VAPDAGRLPLSLIGARAGGGDAQAVFGFLNEPFGPVDVRAGPLTGPSGPGYTMTKHGALGFAEWLTLNYGHQGIRVSCLCPNAVYTGMFGRPLDDESAAPPDGGALGEVLMPEDVAGTVIESMDAERFLILPHPRVGDSFLRKATDYDAWLRRTRDRLQTMH
jgi:NAD(P)-dependent dehydrogenase (short-subunit alcohol dehydrogenase family)